MTTEGWPDDRLTSSDAPSLVRHHAGPAADPDRYELLGEAEGADEAWHVLDHRAAAGEALFTLAALRPAETDDLRVVRDDPPGARTPPEVLWRERASGLARVRHARLAGLVATFTGPAPHPPGRADPRTREWHYAVLEQAAGRSVADWLRDDPGAGVEERFTVLATAAGVVQELHRGSEDVPPVVHGDITPRSVRLGGFWPADGVRLSGASLGGLRRGPLQRRADSVYTAPEVRAGALPSAASDVFGFGATAVLVLTGAPPAASPDGVLDPALVQRQLAAAPLTAPHPGLVALLLQALATDPARRPDRLPAWVNGMRAFVEPGPATDAVAPAVPRPVRSLPRRPVVVVAGALLLATAGTAVAIAAVQQGRLKDVPNPVAIVQPRTPSSSTTPPAPAPPAGDPSPRSSRAQAPATRRPAPSPSAPSPSAPSPAGVPVPPVPTGVPGATPTGGAPAGAPSVAATGAPPAGEMPTPSLIPPTSGAGAPPPGTPTGSPTSVPTGTPTSTPTGTPTGTLTGTPTGSPTGTATDSPTRTPTSTSTSTPTDTSTSTPTDTASSTPTGTPGSTPTSTPAAPPRAPPAAPPRAPRRAPPTPAAAERRVLGGRPGLLWRCGAHPPGAAAGAGTRGPATHTEDDEHQGVAPKAAPTTADGSAPPTTRPARATVARTGAHDRRRTRQPWLHDAPPPPRRPAGVRPAVPRVVRGARVAASSSAGCSGSWSPGWRSPSAASPRPTRW